MGSDSDMRHAVKSFRISTWNCFGMGQRLIDAVTARGAPAPPRLRHREVIDTCAAPDVLCIQELLSRDAQVFFDGLGARGLSSSVRDDNRPHFRSGTVRGSGLGIGARVPIVSSVLENFRGPRTGWDRLARKGALHVRLLLPGGADVDVLTAHLQAGHDAKAVLARARQLDEVRALVLRFASPDRPFFACGDFNIDGLAHARGDEEYLRLRAALPGFDDLGEKDDLPTYHPAANALAQSFAPGGREQRIDYIFFRPARAGRHDFAVNAITRIFDRPIALAETGPGWASDHYGLTADLSYAEAVLAAE